MSAAPQTTPRWIRGLLRRVAPPSRVEDVLGDVEEAHRARLGRSPLVWASVLTAFEALDLALALLRDRPARRASPGIARRGPGFPGISWIDLKLGARMLLRYPGLTIVGGLSMAFGILIGTVSFEFASQIRNPTLPFQGGERVVGIQHVRIPEGGIVNPSLEDFRRWRDAIGSIEELSAFRPLQQNLSVAGGAAEPWPVAAITASGLQLPGVPALLGRVLDASDERSGAPAVVVIGHQLWQSRFGGDRDVLGTDVRLAGVPTTVVGVMPEGFGFPIAHQLWVPLRLDGLAGAGEQGPRLQVFGRLADGIGMEQAAGEVATRSAGASRGAPAELRPRVVPYVDSVVSVPRLGPEGSWALRVFMGMLIAIICGNVALLMFTRILTREGEILVRNALGAGRTRIVSQLFAEALVLSSAAAVLGLAFAGPSLSRLMDTLRIDLDLSALPIWWSGEPSLRTMLYGLGFTLLTAIVAGVLPALRITGRRAGGRLRGMSAGGGGARLGGIWTVVMVAQVAVTVAFPPSAFVFYRYVDHQRTLDVGFPAEEYLTARFQMYGEDELDDEGGVTSDRFAAAWRELDRRLSTDPAVAGVTFAQTVPGLFHPLRPVELEGESGDSDGRPPRERVGVGRVGVDYFETLGVSVRSGRAFRAEDLTSDVPVALVNESFVDGILDGRSAVGRRFRYMVGQAEELGSWYEIVGVVPDLGTVVGDLDPRDDPGVYHPAAAGGLHPASILLHVPDGTESFLPRLRQAALDVDPALRLYEPATVATTFSTSSNVRIMEFLFALIALGCVVGLLLSLAGIYSVMSFAVSRRTREIGIRVALGAEPFRIARSMFMRPVVRVAVGIVLGGLLGGWLSGQLLEGMTTGEAGVITLYAALMMGVCMLACVVPTRRALAIEPTDALRVEG